MARYPDCVRDLVSRGAQRVCLNGIPISVQLGRTRVLELIDTSSKNFGVPGDAAGEAAVAAMQHLGVRTIAVGSRWADEVNDALIQYLADAGIDVLAITSRGQWAQQAFSMSFEMGVRLAFELGREAMRQAPQAEALFLPGGTWRPLPAVPILEEDYGKPVFTNGNTQAWRLIHDGIAPPVHGWGRLLATP
jgi:maleate cis-trans isomerase